MNINMNHYSYRADGPFVYASYILQCRKKHFSNVKQFRLFTEAYVHVIPLFVFHYLQENNSNHGSIS